MDCTKELQLSALAHVHTRDGLTGERHSRRYGPPLKVEIPERAVSGLSGNEASVDKFHSRLKALTKSVPSTADDPHPTSIW